MPSRLAYFAPQFPHSKFRSMILKSEWRQAGQDRLISFISSSSDQTLIRSAPQYSGSIGYNYWLFRFGHLLVKQLVLLHHSFNCEVLFEVIIRAVTHPLSQPTIVEDASYRFSQDGRVAWWHQEPGVAGNDRFRNASDL